MRFLLRLLLVLALGSYLWSHYGLFVRQRLLSVESGDNQQLLRRVPALADSPLYRQPSQASPRLDYYRVAT